MWYLGLYMASGVIVNLAIVIRMEQVYKGLNYESEYDEAVDVINDSLSAYYGRWYILLIILGIITVLTTWPVQLFIAWRRYVTLINQIITNMEENDECPDED